MLCCIWQILPGLRDTDDPVEKMGVELARKRLNSSYLVLAVFDSSEELSAEDLELIEKIKDRPGCCSNQ